MELRDTLADAGKWAGTQASIGLNLLFGSRAEDSFGILMYHRVFPVSEGRGAPTWNVTPDRFERQLRSLLERGYRFWPLQRLVSAAREGARIPARVAALTFDDGYGNVYGFAYPVLQALGVPATVFVASAFIGGSEPFPFDDWEGAGSPSAPLDSWRPLTWAECRKMEESGLIEIGTHSHTHRDFRGRPGELLEDLSASLEAIRRILGPGPRTFAFPFGNTRLGFADRSLQDAARASGVVCALNSEIGLNDARRSPFEWRRLEVVEHDLGASLEAKLEGWYGWMDSARGLFCRISPPAVAQAHQDRRVLQS
jgi:peptidoglycan/xylan/chitin deacetylase (PgdA/CDA1 family)